MRLHVASAARPAPPLGAPAPPLAAVELAPRFYKRRPCYRLIDISHSALERALSLALSVQAQRAGRMRAIRSGSRASAMQRYRTVINVVSFQSPGVKISRRRFSLAL
jgi:hypothetical protein